MFKKKQKGFTLIELLIVIAIIAILAAIAIPQFSAYRIRGFNSSAESDIRNWKTTEEAMNSSFFSYANSVNGVIPPGGAAPPPGVCVGGPLIGPMSAASTASAGAYLQAPFYASRSPVNLVLGAIGIGIGNNVHMCADSAPGGDPMQADRAILSSKHLEGDTVFAADMDSTALYWCKNDAWPKVPMAGTGVGIVSPGVFQVDDYAGGAVACGGIPIGNWTAL